MTVFSPFLDSIRNSGFRPSFPSFLTPLAAEAFPIYLLWEFPLAKNIYFFYFSAGYAGKENAHDISIFTLYDRDTVHFSSKNFMSVRCQCKHVQEVCRREEATRV